MDSDLLGEPKQSMHSFEAEEARERERQRREQQEHEDWLRARKRGIGGSDASVILGVNPFRTIQDLYEDKISDHIHLEKPNPAMKRGLVLEPVAAELYVEETGRKVRRQPMRTHPDHEWMIGNVDRQILAVGDVESTGVLEIKCPGLQIMAHVKAHGLSDYMTVQLMHYLAVYGYSWGSFCLFNAERWDLIYFDLERDDDFIDRLIEKEYDFWHNHVVPRIPPPTEESTLDIPQVEGELTVVQGGEWVKPAEDFREARELKKAASDLETMAREQIKELMHRDEIHAAEIPGIARFYYKPYPGRTNWKQTAAAIASEAGLRLDDFLVQGESFTRFMPYFMKGKENG